MNIAEINDIQRESDLKSLTSIRKYASTLAFARKVDDAARSLDQFFTVCKKPVISCGGGKDGTAIALLSMRIGGNVPIVCADPPNPLPDREAHKAILREFLSASWIQVPYLWDVGAVLSGKKKYPDGMKMQKLSEWQRRNEVDGVVFGIRAAESRSREINLARNGTIYQTKAGLRCQPIARWSAYDSLCLAMIMDAPINPVYEKMGGVGNLEQLHDGTWWPHGIGDRLGWIRRYYPEYAELYERALLLESTGADMLCRY